MVDRVSAGQVSFTPGVGARSDRDALGLPHTYSSATDDFYAGYRIPKGSLVIANAWYVTFVVWPRLKGAPHFTKDNAPR